MGVLLWIMFGAAVGGIASLVNPAQRSLRGVAVALALGTLGAMLGGFVGRALGLYRAASSTGAMVTAAVGSVGLLAAYHALFATRRIY